MSRAEFFNFYKVYLFILCKYTGNQYVNQWLLTRISFIWYINILCTRYRYPGQKKRILHHTFFQDEMEFLRCLCCSFRDKAWTVFCKMPKFHKNNCYEKYCICASKLTFGKPIAVWSKSASAVSVVNPLVSFYNIQGGKGEVLFSAAVLETTRKFLYHRESIVYQIKDTR
jgi:hypothetical protein